MKIGEINPRQKRSIAVSPFNNLSKAPNAEESYVDDSTLANIDQSTIKSDQR